MGNFFIRVFTFILALALIPVVIAVSISLKEYIPVYPEYFQHALWWGAGFSILTFVFLFQFARVFAAGQSLTNKILSFMSPSEGLAGYVVPIYPLIIFLAHFLAKRFWVEVDGYTYYIISLYSFMSVFHLLHVAQEVRGESKNSFSAKYLNITSLTFISLTFFLILFLDMNVEKLTIKDFFILAAHHTQSIYQLIIDKFSSI